LLLTWVINNICSNHCSYCPDDLHNGGNHHYDWNYARNFIKSCFDQYKTVQCNLSGGEPTLSPFFKDLIRLIYDNGGTVNLTTNMVRSIDWWQDIAPYFCAIAASYHAEFMDNDSENEYIEKINAISRVTEVNARVMMHPDRWDQCINMHERLVASCPYATVEMVRIYPTFGTEKVIRQINYSDYQNKILNEHKPLRRSFRHKGPLYRPFYLRSDLVFQDGESQLFTMDVASYLVNNKLTDFSGWQCHIGLESLFVHYNGNVQRANCGVGGLIGNIKTDIVWPKSAVICNKNFCHCIADVHLTKNKL
jgi:organic radical activating enzyme